MKRNGLKTFLVWVVFLLIIFFVVQSILSQNKEPFTYSDLLTQIKNDNVESIEISYDGQSATVKLRKEISSEGNGGLFGGFISYNCGNSTGEIFLWAFCKK